MTRRAATRARARALGLGLGLAAAAAGAFGCKADPPAPTSLSGGSCSDCHGGADNPAPPRATNGATATTELAVGAHQAHVQPGALGAGVACSECHVMPARLDDPGHLDAAPAEITWGPLAAAASAEPVWSRAEATCAGTYCHGATLTGGVAVTPSWTSPMGPLGCDGCHGAPPPAPHPEDGDCGACHPGVMVQNGALVIDLGASTHLDGSVELVGELCARCHGGPDNAAPPRSLEGASATSDVTVGAHQAHVRQGPLALAFPCQECHVVPTTLDEPTHQDASPAEVSWGVTAIGPGLAPTWDRDAGTCSDVYCHGATLGGGLVAAPTWTVVDGTQAFCGACHGLPPPPPHPASSDCKACHQATMDPAGGLDVAGGFHVNGVTDFVPASACNACHGGAANAAPPSATTGESDTTVVGVGAHQAHVAGGSLRGPIPCQECHVVPSSVGEATHMDGLPAEVVWGVLPLADDASPAWDRPSATCSAVYCHGSTLGGGSLTAPVWTEVGTGQAACGTCHGLPPPSPHPPRSECWKCHADTVDDTGQVLVGGGKHVNGVVDVGDLGCNSCHGGAENAA
ncbi:MAG: CxxxxCH/CxxCH domain-containing protein, partial [Polyangiaceae bacterium]|nr:CxxxxCH/CxxCH domain-containing protein [Polyangiaceae bacterium]